MPKRYDNIIYKLFLRSNIIRIRPIVCIEDPKEAPGVNYVHIEDTKVEETTIADIVTTGHPVENNAISVINLDASQASI